MLTGVVAMRSRSELILSAMTMSRRSEATGWKRARISSPTASMRFSNWLMPASRSAPAGQRRVAVLERGHRGGELALLDLVGHGEQVLGEVVAAEAKG